MGYRIGSGNTSLVWIHLEKGSCDVRNEPISDFLTSPVKSIISWRDSLSRLGIKTSGCCKPSKLEMGQALVRKAMDIDGKYDEV